MKFSEQWLREWVKTDLNSEQLTQQLTMLGLEVDDVESAAAEFSHVVVGEIIGAEKHPDADKLKVCQVSVGDQQLQIVCGAPNARVGLKAPLAMIGAVLPGNFKIKKSKLRGIESHGMLCSEKELGMSEDANGLMELPQSLNNGDDIREILQLDDLIIDIDLTPNRADCFCIQGIAREVAVANNVSVQKPNLVAVESVSSAAMDVEVKAKKQCPKYYTRIISGIDGSQKTPSWMSEKLRRSGIRCIHPVVDVTNYVMLELGQPMHGFDQAQIDKKIIVRMAHENEEIELLDSQKVKLDESYLVIADASKPLAIAGVIGGLSSGVTETTQDIVLESAYFDPATIMGKSRDLGVHTESALRFERGVDTQLQEIALQRATELIVNICGGRVGEINKFECNDAIPKVNDIHLSRKKLDRVLGFQVENTQVNTILSGLGLQPEVTKEGWSVKVPSWRFDLSIPEDIIEEIVRVVGYDHMPQIALSAEQYISIIPEQMKTDVAFQHQLQQLGYQEVINYSFVSEQQLKHVSANENAIALANPLSQEMAVMRTSLLPGILSNLKHNLDRQFERLSLYEKGVVFSMHDEVIVEKEMLIMARCGDRNEEHWLAQSEAVDFYDIKGDLQCVVKNDKLMLKSSQYAFLHPGRQAALVLSDNPETIIGWIGQLHPGVAKKLKIRKDVVVCQVQLDTIRSVQLPEWQPVSKFPTVRRDLSVLLQEDISWSAIKQGIKQVVDQCGQSLIDVVLFDVYRGENIEKGCKSLAIGMIFQEKNRTLEDKEVDKMVEKAVSFLSQEFNAEIRGGQ